MKRQPAPALDREQLKAELVDKTLLAWYDAGYITGDPTAQPRPALQWAAPGRAALFSSLGLALIAAPYIPDPARAATGLVELVLDAYPLAAVQELNNRLVPF